MRLRLPVGMHHGKQGKRRKCSGFSRRAALAMKRILFAIDQDKIGTGLFVTLTYPADHPTAQASKRDLDTYLKRLGRAHPNVTGLWKLEPQRRGAPHYHLLLFFLREITPEDEADFRVWSATNWVDVVDATERGKHLYVSQREESCTRLRTWEGALSYGAKYIGKLTDDQGDQLPGWKDAGRYWGKHRGKLLPIEMITEQLAPAAAVQIRRAMRRFLARQPSDRYVLTDQDSGKVKRKKHLDEKTKRVLAGFGYRIHQVKRGRSRSSGGLAIFLRANTAQALITWANKQPTPTTAVRSLARSISRHHRDLLPIVDQDRPFDQLEKWRVALGIPDTRRELQLLHDWERIEFCFG